MTSRTSKGKHTKHFIIEVRFGLGPSWYRSQRIGLKGLFATREGAKAALNPCKKEFVSSDLEYRVRQK